MRTLTFLSAVLAMLAARGSTEACCTAGSRGQLINIARQEILVAWNPATKIEHFVRRATFRAGDAKADFGFLVPTPTKPTLAEARDGAFDRLFEVTRPEVRDEVVTRYEYSLLSRFAASRIDAGADMAPTWKVSVLDRVTVAGYDAAILEADNAEALTRWLGDNGYDVRPEITDWVAPYVAKRWKVTAFKYSRSADPAAASRAGGVGAGTLRMTFETDRPLFPYRVPSDQRGGHDTLRVYYAGAERADGTLGDAGEPWQKETKYSRKVAGLDGILEGAVPKGEAGSWLTVFEDHRWPGGVEDLYFAPSKDPSPVIPAPRINYVSRTVYVPVDVLIVLALAVGGIWAWKRRRPSQAV